MNISNLKSGNFDFVILHFLHVDCIFDKDMVHLTTKPFLQALETWDAIKHSLMPIRGDNCQIEATIVESRRQLSN